jgi:hypothetical protein
MTVTLEQVLAVLSPEEPDYSAFDNLGAEALSYISDLVTGDSPILASKAVYLASLIQNDQAVEIMRIGAQSADPIIRVAVAAGVRNLNEVDGSKISLILLDDADTGVQKVTLKSMKTTGSSEVKLKVEALNQQGNDEFIRQLSADVLSRIDTLPQVNSSNISMDCRSLGHDWLILFSYQTRVAVPSPTDPSSGGYFRARDHVLNFFLEDGLYQIILHSGNLSIVYFTVTAGIITYDPELEGVISGAGTSALVLHGLPITIDATEVQDFLVYIPAVYGLDGFETSNASRPLFTGNFLPNCHDITDGWGYRFNIAGGVNASFTFKVQLNGLVTYEPEFDDSVTGRGTNVLKISSFTPFVDS